MLAVLAVDALTLIDFCFSALPEANSTSQCCHFLQLPSFLVSYVIAWVFIVFQLVSDTMFEFELFWKGKKRTFFLDSFEIRINKAGRTLSVKFGFAFLSY